MKNKPILINNYLYYIKNKKIIYLDKFIKKYFIILKINFIFIKILHIFTNNLFKIINLNKGIIFIETINYSCKINILKKQHKLLNTIKYNISKNIFYIKIKVNYDYIKNKFKKII
ncbi:MAG: hypothetical protein ACH6QO_01130 [Candidatus Makana argininalis]